MKDEFVSRVGIWGQRHYNWLKKSKPTVINTMRMKGMLEQYLTDIDRDAREMFDRMMKEFDKTYPGYGFSSHKGYGTKAHYEALRKLGPSKIHRKTFLKNMH